MRVLQAETIIVTTSNLRIDRGVIAVMSYSLSVRKVYCYSKLVVILFLPKDNVSSFHGVLSKAQELLQFF